MKQHNPTRVVFQSRCPGSSELSSRDKVRWTQVAFVSFRSILTDLDEFKTGLDRVSRSLIQSEPNKKSGVQLTRGKNKWFATVQPETLKKKCPRPAFCVAWTSMWSQTLKRVRAHYPKLRRVRSCLRRRLGPGASHQTVAQSPAHIPFTPQEKSQKRKHPTWF